MRCVASSLGLVLLLAAPVGGCRRETPAQVHPVVEPTEVTVTIVPRTPEIATFPCVSACHVRLTPNPTPRALHDFHAGRVLNHGPTITWCTFCHQDDNLDRLHLIDGTLVTFDEAYRVCGQCHPQRVRDWNRGIHGLNTGSWAGEHQRRSCPVCHDPHDPHRPVFQALPPPPRDRAYPGQ